MEFHGKSPWVLRYGSIRAPEHYRRTKSKNNRQLRRLAGVNKSIIIRAPIVSGYDDSPEGVRRMAGLLPVLKSVERVDLLLYQKYGTEKYG